EVGAKGAQVQEGASDFGFQIVNTRSINNTRPEVLLRQAKVSGGRAGYRARPSGCPPYRCSRRPGLPRGAPDPAAPTALPASIGAPPWWILRPIRAAASESSSIERFA